MMLAGAALAAVGVSIALGLELGLMEPWLASVLARRMSGEALPTIPTELFVIAGFFALAVFGSLYFSARVAYAFRLPGLLRLDLARTARTGPGNPNRSPAMVEARTRHQEAERTRAAAVAASFSTLNRRERLALLEGAAAPPPHERAVQVRSSAGESGSRAVPLGNSFTRRSTNRVSAMAVKRDAAS